MESLAVWANLGTMASACSFPCRSTGPPSRGFLAVVSIMAMFICNTLHLLLNWVNCLLEDKEGVMCSGKLHFPIHFVLGSLAHNINSHGGAWLLAYKGDSYDDGWLLADADCGWVVAGPHGGSNGSCVIRDQPT